MESPIYLRGSGQTAFGEHWQSNLSDLMRQAIDAAIADAGCTALDIDMIIVSNMVGQQLSGQAHLGAVASSLLPHQPPALRVEAACASGSVAVHTACSLLKSGDVQTILVVGAEKMTDVDNKTVANALIGAADSEIEGVAGLTFPGVFGLIAQRYMHDYQLSRDELSLVSSHHHQQALSNPNAQFRRAVSPEAVSASTPVADPLRLLDCSPISDGAAACVLSTKLESPFRLAASQLSTDTVSLADRTTITSFSATRTAMNNALQQAGIEREEVSHIEYHDCFSIAAVINLEDLGYAKPGEGIRHFTKPSDQLTLNASGGLKACGHPVGATGIKQLGDICKQLKQSQHQYGLTHNFGGAGATCCIHIIEQDA